MGLTHSVHAGKQQATDVATGRSRDHAETEIAAVQAQASPTAPTLRGRNACAADGLAGLESARSIAPDLIICDFMMPRVNGFQVLATLQADPGLKNVPVIMISASAEPERLAQAIALGACAYVTKPFLLAQLRALLDRHLAAA